ncbi:hypothetical protein CSB09_02225 [Candidatus Gracilibacteria bacterium]|nr:MAG: hypothetical protein CSB09_02225 [Candidatus Gracilibacteria bacterium]
MKIFSMPTFSAIIPAYNEGPRIEEMIDAVLGCKELDEIIIINDGSTDDTWEKIQTIKDPRCIKMNNTKNCGKMKSVMRAIKKSNGDYIVMIDSDLIGLKSYHIKQLIDPIMTQLCDTTLSLRDNSLRIYKLLKTDFVSGERVIPKEIFEDTAFFVGKSFGLEVKINEKILEKNLIRGNVKLKGVITPNKSKKIGFFAGTWADIKMVGEILCVLPFYRVIYQLFAFSRFSNRARFFSSPRKKL